MDRLLDFASAAERLGIATKTMRNRLSQGTWPIKPVRIGRRVMWRESDITDVVAGRIEIPPGVRREEGP